MSELWQRINKDLIAAMKGRQEFELSVLRMLVSSLKNKKIALGNKEELNDEQVLEVVKSEVKKRKDSAEEYKRGGREDLADKELAEIEIIGKYMPEQMSDEEVEAAVGDLIDSLGDVSAKDFGVIMGQAMAKLKGKADGSAVSAAVKKILSK